MDRTLDCRSASVACLVLLALALAVPVPAQEARWKELNAQVEQLYQSAKFAEAIPPAQESIRVAEATWGAQDSRQYHHGTTGGRLGIGACGRRDPHATCSPRLSS